MEHSKKYASVAITVICVMLGVIIGVQLNTVKKNGLSTEQERLSDMTQRLQSLEEEKSALEDKISEQEKQIQAYEEEEETDEMLQQSLQEARNFAGLTTAYGPGLMLTMTDGAIRSGDSNAYVIHAEDILAVINELWSAGAEAISINGERVVSTTAITCAGSIIHVNDVRVAAPFEILAIGDAAVMESALTFSGGVVDNLKPWGIQIEMKAQTALKIPAYRGTTSWSVASSEQNTNHSKEAEE